MNGKKDLFLVGSIKNALTDRAVSDYWKFNTWDFVDQECIKFFKSHNSTVRTSVEEERSMLLSVIFNLASRHKDSAKLQLYYPNAAGADTSYKDFLADLYRAIKIKNVKIELIVDKVPNLEKDAVAEVNLWSVIKAHVNDKTGRFNDRFEIRVVNPHAADSVTTLINDKIGDNVFNFVVDSVNKIYCLGTDHTKGAFNTDNYTMVLQTHDQKGTLSLRSAFNELFSPENNYTVKFPIIDIPKPPQHPLLDNIFD